MISKAYGKWFRNIYFVFCNFFYDAKNYEFLYRFLLPHGNKSFKLYTGKVIQLKSDSLKKQLYTHCICCRCLRLTMFMPSEPKASPSSTFQHGHRLTLHAQFYGKRKPYCNTVIKQQWLRFLSLRKVCRSNIVFTRCSCVFYLATTTKKKHLVHNVLSHKYY